MALLDLVQNDGNNDEVTTASRRARPKAGDDTAAFPLIRCTKEDEIKRRNLRHGEESMERGRDRVGEDSSATTSVVFVMAGASAPYLPPCCAMSSSSSPHDAFITAVANAVADTVCTDYKPPPGLVNDDTIAQSVAESTATKASSAVRAALAKHLPPADDANSLAPPAQPTSPAAGAPFSPLTPEVVALLTRLLTTKFDNISIGKED
uniref:Uncharacterized protein n=1 Tax=Oryza meridionalis TaxID=40149 RepID=A0A0E0C250_9ORYZ